MKCFYHRDMDGKCAGAIVFHKTPLKYPEMVDIDYKDILDLKTISPNEEIWIVDFSFKPEVMEEILKITQNIIWIDHHKTSMEYKYSKELSGIRDNNFSGCELTWKFIHPEIPLPIIVEMLGRYDVWDFSKWGEKLNQLQAGIRLWETEPSHPNWTEWLKREASLDKELEGGYFALRYRNNQAISLIKALSFFAEFEGYSAVCCNAGLVSSQLFDSVKEDYDLMIPFYFDGKQWTVSLYTKKDIDCSEIAKKYGGGGHKKAAGFQCKELPFKIAERRINNTTENLL
jgi:oligoribonuclease NrnB/cAMP/cGMP phosphodiesterase (DHH superfamily)